MTSQIERNKQSYHHRNAQNLVLKGGSNTEIGASNPKYIDKPSNTQNKKTEQKSTLHTGSS
jgi:hypothetical protein